MDNCCGSGNPDTVMIPKPEAVYFTEYDGERGAIMIVDVKEPSKVPHYAEPWLHLFNADVEFHIAMTPDDLARRTRCAGEEVG